MGKRKKGEVPKPKVHKASGRAYVYLDGRRVWLGRAGTTVAMEEFDRVLAAWLSGGRSLPPPPQGEDLLLSELALAYLDHLEGRFAPREGQPHPEVRQTRVVLEEALALYPDLEASELSPLRLERVRDRLVARGNCRGQVNAQISRVKRCYRWASSRQLVPKLVHLALLDLEGLKRGQTRAPEGTRRRPVSKEDYEAVLPHLLPPLAAVVELLWWSGARPTEILKLTMADLDRSGPVWILRPAHHKLENKGLGREIPLGPRAQAVLKPWFRADPNAYLFQPAEALETQATARRQARQTPLWPSHLAAKAAQKAKREAEGRSRQVQESYGQAALRTAVGRACKAAGVSVWSPYQLRHAAASRIAREEGYEIARVILGHKHIRTTEVYVEADYQRAREAAARMG